MIRKHLRDKVYERDEGRCAVCAVYDAHWEADHIHEIWAGGPDDIDNLQTLCRRHHREKTDAQTPLRAKADRLNAKHEQTKRRKQIVRVST